MSRKIVPVIFSLLLGLLLFPSLGLAIPSLTWQDGNGDWHLPANWTQPDPLHPRFPGYGDAAFINNHSEVTVSQGEGITQLEVDADNSVKITGTLGLNTTAQASPAYINNNGIIRVGGPGYTGSLGSWGSDVTLQGNGAVVLGGHYPQDQIYNSGGGNSFTNAAGHTIRGGGNILSLKINRGSVIADNVGLYIRSAVDNLGSAMTASGAGNTLWIYGNGDITGGLLTTQDGGKITLTGCILRDLTLGPGLVEVIKDWVTWNVYFQNTVTLASGTTLNIAAGGVPPGGSEVTPNGINFGPDNGTATLVNNGAIFMNGQQCYLGGYCHLILQGTGSLTMQGDADNFFQCYDVTLQPPQIIQGSGTAQCKIINNSTLIASNGAFTVINGISGAGTISVADSGTLNLQGGIWPEKAVQAGDLTMSQLAALTVNNNVNIDLKRNFSFAQKDPAKWSWGGTGNALKMSGQGPWQTLEVGGQDIGADANGLTNNFALPMLQLDGAGTQVKLVDLIDNGHRSAGGREVLYVDTLEVLPDTTLNLNGLKLYAYLDGNMHWVRAGEGGLFGGGKIIDGGGFLSAVDLLLLLED